MPITEGERRALAVLHQSAPRWEDAVLRILTAVESAARMSIQHYDLEEIHSQDSPMLLDRRIAKTTEQRMAPLPIVIDYVSIRSILPSAETIQWQNKLSHEVAEAGVLRDSLSLIAQGYASARSMGLGDEALLQILRSTSGPTSIAETMPSATRMYLVARLKLDIEPDELGERGAARLVTDLAELTKTPPSEMRLLYTITGSVIAAVVMPDEAYDQLERMILGEDSRLSYLRIEEIRKVKVTEHEVNPRNYLSFDYNYEHGLNQLRQMLKDQPRGLMIQFHTLEDRLIAGTHGFRLFGVTADSLSRRSQAIHALNELVYSIDPGSSFTDLCKRRTKLPDGPPDGRHAPPLQQP